MHAQLVELPEGPDAGDPGRRSVNIRVDLQEAGRQEVVLTLRVVNDVGG